MRKRPRPAGYHWDESAARIHPETGRRTCRWCKGPVRPPKRNWCDDPACLDAWRFRTDPAYFRSTIFARDRGVCSLCGLDAHALDLDACRGQVERAVEAARVSRHGARSRALPPDPPAPPLDPLEYWLGRLAASYQWRADCNVPVREPAWQVDHVTPVALGGDWFDPINLRTLCTPCHRVQTARLNRELAAGRRAAKKASAPSGPRVRVRKRKAP